MLATLLVGAALAGVAALLLAVRPRNPLGPLLLLSGTVLVAQMALREAAYRGLAVPTRPPGSAVLGWASAWLDVLGLPLPLVVVLLLFPDGTLPSRRWRPVVAATVLVGIVQLGRRAAGPGPGSPGLARPVRPVGRTLDVPASVYDSIDAVDRLLGALLVLVAAASLLVRYRAGDAETRQRLKPLGLSAMVMVCGLGVQLLPGLQVAGVVVFVAGGVSVPFALAVGALRYRVWDLDPLLIRALEYAGLAVVIAAAYVGVVEVVALAVGQPVQGTTCSRRCSRPPWWRPRSPRHAPGSSTLARRLVLGDRASPYDTLARSRSDWSTHSEVDAVLPVTAETLAAGPGCRAAGVRVTLADGESWAAWFPTPRPDEERDGLEVRHLGVPVGELSSYPDPTGRSAGKTASCSTTWPPRPARRCARSRSMPSSPTGSTSSRSSPPS